jgi:hypothetical protein
MATTRALSQLDVVTAIVSQVQPQDTLASLARTSHIISEVALDKLWRSSFNFVALARCMPQQYWEEIETSAESFPGSARLRHRSEIVSCYFADGSMLQY